MHNIIYLIYINSIFHHSINLDSTSEGLLVLRHIFWHVLKNKQAKQFLDIYTVPYYYPKIQYSLWVITVESI